MKRILTETFLSKFRPPAQLYTLEAVFWEILLTQRAGTRTAPPPSLAGPTERSAELCLKRWKRTASSSELGVSKARRGSAAIAAVNRGPEPRPYSLLRAG